MFINISGIFRDINHYCLKHHLNSAFICDFSSNCKTKWIFNSTERFFIQRMFTFVGNCRLARIVTGTTYLDHYLVMSCRMVIVINRNHSVWAYLGINSRTSLVSSKPNTDWPERLTLVTIYYLDPTDVITNQLSLWSKFYYEICVQWVIASSTPFMLMVEFWISINRKKLNR